MRNLARSYVWWPKMDTNLEGKVKSCDTCQSHQKMPPCTPLHPWEWPGRPWSQVHVDYTGPFMGEMLLLIIEAHSKWMDIHCANCATSSVTIDRFRPLYRYIDRSTLPTVNTIRQDEVNFCFTWFTRDCSVQ